MNFRKILSGVSALTIAASAFAGLAVTASAGTASLSWVNTDGTYGYGTTISNATVTYKNTSLGTASASGGIVNGSRGSGTYTVLDNALLADPNGNLTIEFGLDIAGGSASGSAGDTTQTICFMSSAYQPTGRTLQSVPSSDVLFKLSKTTSGDVYLNGDTALSIPNAENGNNADNTNFGGNTVRQVTGVIKYKVIFDFNNDSLTLFADTGSGYPSTGISGSILDADATGLYGIFVNSTNKRSYSGFVMTDISYEEYVATAATSVVTRYTLNGSPIITDPAVDISGENKNGGDEYSYATPKYVSYNDSVYSTGISKKTVTLANGTTTVDIPVTLAAATGYFFEAESNGGNADVASNDYSMGMGRRRLDQKQVTITVPADGIYTVAAGLADARSNNNEATISVYSGSYSAEATPLFSYTTNHTNAYYGNEMEQTNIALRSGTTLSFYTADWNMGLDYVLLKKTADYPYAITKAATENGSFTVSAETATAGTTVTITPSAAEGYEVDTVSVATAAVTDNGNGTYSFTMPADDVTVSVTFKTIPVVGPTATIDEVSYNKYPASETSSSTDADITAAKIYITTTGTVTKLGLTYDGSEPKYAQNLAVMSGEGTIVLGAVVPGLVDLTTSSFGTVVE